MPIAAYFERINLVLSAMVAVSFAPVTAFTQSCNNSSREAPQVAVVASGGISKGAYQAGALWAIMQVERAKRANPGAGENAITLKSLTGASAGNVNALLLAIEWATALDSTRQTERTSSLWTTWTNVGFETLLPENPADTVHSLLDPRAFDGAKAGIAADASTKSFLECTVPLGMTLTRASGAGRFSFQGIQDLRVQRYTSVAKFVSDASGFRLHRLKKEDLRQSAGAAISAVGDPHIRLEEFFTHVQASASFPFAFPPVAIKFTPIDSAALRESTCGPGSSTSSVCAYPLKDYFLDGGAFDNNPVSLVRDLLPGGNDSLPLKVWFVSPGKRRRNAGALPPSTEVKDSVKIFGVLQYAQFGLTVIGTAADYELFALERQLRAAGPGCGGAGKGLGLCVVPTTRYFPIYGATGNSFGAFLGKPLREIDFYVGIYDGLYASYEHGVCRTAGANQEQCVKSQLANAIRFSSAAPELSGDGRAILRALYSKEFPAEPTIDGPPATPRVDKLVDLLDALNDYELKLTPEGRQREDDECKKLTAELALFCTGGLRSALVRHGSHPTARQTRSLDEQEDEDRFQGLLSSFESELFRFAKPMIHRQWQVESGTKGARYLTRMSAKILRFVVATDEGQYRRGFYLDPSTVPLRASEGGRKWFWLNVFPYSYEKWSGHDRFTWSPSIILHKEWELGIGPTLVHDTRRIFNTRNWDLGGGGRLRTPSIKQKVGKMTFSFAVEAQKDCMVLDCTHYLQSVGISTFRRRLKLNYVQLVGPGKSKSGGIAFGVNDVPGLLHLIVPQW